jgi:hypothetical protein
MKKLIVALVATAAGITAASAVDATGKPLKIGRWYTSHEYEACQTQKAAVMLNTLRWVDATEKEPALVELANKIAKSGCVKLKPDQRYQVEKIDDQAFPMPLACVRAGEKVMGGPMPCLWTPQHMLRPS